MGKLKDDEIKWILNVEASGAQASIQKISSYSKRLAEDNVRMRTEMKAATAQMNAAEKEMKRLEKAGATTSDAYTQAKRTFESAKEEVADYTRKIAANTKSIKENNSSIDKMIKEMKLEEMTMDQLEKRARQLEKQLKHTALASSPAEYRRLNNELTAVQDRMETVNNANKNLMQQLVSIPGPIGVIAKSVQGLTVAVKALFATPVGWILALIGTLTIAIKKFFDFNNEYGKLMSILEQLTDQTGDRLKKSAAQIKSFAEMVNEDQKALAKTVNSTARNFGISWDEAFEIVKEGYARCGDAADSFFSNSEEFTKAFAKAGYSAKEYFSIVEQSAKAGIPKDKILGALREFDIRIREFSSKTEKVLKETLGEKLTSELSKGLASGEINSKEAFQRISEESKKLGINLQENQKIAAALFGKMGKQAGDFSDVVDVTNKGLSETNRSLTVMEQAMLKEAAATEELEKTWGALFNQSDGTFQMWMSSTKAWFYEGLVKLINGVVDLINYFIELYNESMVFRGAIENIGATFDLLYNTASFVFKWILESFKASAGMLEGIFNLDFDKIKTSWAAGLKNIGGEFNSFLQKQKADSLAAYEAITNPQKVDKIKLDLETPDDPNKKVVTNNNYRENNDDGDNSKEVKKALEKKLKNIENELQQELNLLKKKQLEGLISQKEYDKESERLTLESINKKIALKGQEKDKYLTLEQQSLDLQLKSQEKADKELFESLKKEREKELQLLEVTKNTLLEKLQEEETDRVIYALRASEIEANYLEARKQVIEQFGKTLEQAEFNNGKAQADAVKENGKEIINAESATLKERGRLKKLFLKTTADFEKQFNIKTWEQRKKDELDILNKQYNTVDSSGKRLLSDEAYEIAKTQIEKKYSDERLKIREQYQIASISELYNQELEALKENHRLSLLSEEEFEAAKLKLKLDYAQKYTEQAAQFIQMGGDAVSALMEAETVNVENEYDARIQAAQGNAEEVERLENEKAQKKLNIEKKYADVQFAIKASEIISSTALAVMQALAQLGPIAGAVAAAFVGTTGAAQLVVANKERQRVKNMTLAGSGSTKTGTRVVDGYADGGFNAKELSGYTGDGDRYEVAGTFENDKDFHKGEYIIAQPEMKVPSLGPHIQAIERVRRKRTNKNPLPDGFAEGGFNSHTSSSTKKDETNVLIEILAYLKYLKETGLPALIAFDEFQKQMQLIEMSKESAKRG